MTRYSIRSEKVGYLESLKSLRSLWTSLQHMRLYSGSKNNKEFPDVLLNVDEIINYFLRFFKRREV